MMLSKNFKYFSPNSSIQIFPASSPMGFNEIQLIGKEACRWTTLDFKNYWAIVEEGTPVLQHFAEEIPSVKGIKKGYDISWYSEAKSEYVITTAEELYAALEDAKKQTVSTLFDIKVAHKSMTDGYDSWWRVGVAEVSTSEKVQAAYEDMQANIEKARLY